MAPCLGVHLLQLKSLHVDLCYSLCMRFKGALTYLRRCLYETSALFVPYWRSAARDGWSRPSQTWPRSARTTPPSLYLPSASSSAKKMAWNWNFVRQCDIVLPAPHYQSLEHFTPRNSISPLTWGPQKPTGESTLATSSMIIGPRPGIPIHTF